MKVWIWNEWTTIWCKIVFQINVERTNGNYNGGSYFDIYHFGDLVQKTILEKNYMPTIQGTFLRILITKSEL